MNKFIENLKSLKSGDTSGKFSKESFLLKNYPEEHSAVINFCEVNGFPHIPFGEKVYLTINEITEYPKCSNKNCQNLVKFKNSTLGYKSYCSSKCVGGDDGIRELKKIRSLEKWGVDTPSKSDIVKNKIIKTNNLKWGGNSPMSNETIREKSVKTLLDNWGVDNPSKSEFILNRRIESFKLSDFKENFKKTCIEKWGVDNPWKVREIHQKGIEHFYEDYRRRILDKISGGGFEFIGFDKSGNNTNLIFNCGECGENFEINTYQFYYRINSKIPICTKCHPISESTSISKEEVYKFIKKNYSGEIIQNSKVLNSYEIDIYLPQMGIGFEYNGVWWHSDKYKTPDYHLNKIKTAREKSIKIYSIWEDDWLIKNDICKSFILNKLKGNIRKIYARKCRIVGVSSKESRNFLINNHLQGDCSSSVRLGLYYEDELVSLMTFSNPRLPLGGGGDFMELTRFCNKIETTVIGSASKLFKFFLRNYNTDKIISYSDNLISEGEIYEKLGFYQSGESKPGYWYLINKKRVHRFNWRKHKLVKMGYDVNKTEGEIMNELGYQRVYNGGNKKWIYENKKTHL